MDISPEERLIRIENAIQALVENQARHDVQIEKQNAGIRDLIVVSRTLLDTQLRANGQIGELSEVQKHTEERIAKLAESQKHTDERIAKLAESQKHTDERIAKLTEVQKHTDEKLNVLIDTVDRFIRRNGKDR